MPIYEYRCAACGFQKEYLQKMSDAPLTDCPECGKATLGKMVTAAGFQLKGSGWYVTDFRQGSKPAADGVAKSGAKVDTKSDGKAESKSDSKAQPASGDSKAASDTSGAAKKSDTASSTASSSGSTGSTPASSTPTSSS